MIHYSNSTESFLARLNLLFVLVTLAWKTVGMAWVPFGLGDAWNKVLDPEGFFWPRNNHKESEYLLFHLMMYCVGGLLAQWSSLNLTTGVDPNNRAGKTAKNCFGSFHVAIAVYHVHVVFQIVQGKALLFEKSFWSELTWVRPALQILYVMELVVAGSYLTNNDYQQSRQQKTCLDVLSLLNFLPMASFTFLIALVDFEDDLMAFWINATLYMILPSFVLLMEVFRNWQCQWHLLHAHT